MSTPPPNRTAIERLEIQRFRGVESLRWVPHSGLNLILGGGDAGKSCILEAIGLLLNPSTSYSLNDSDYWGRKVEVEFLIEAVLSLGDWVGIEREGRMHLPWHWDGQNLLDAPTEGGDFRAVYRVRVRGTADLELVYEIVEPNEDVRSFGPALRRAIGVVRLSGDDRNDRDLRLVQGSALDRVINDKGFRARVAHKIAAEPVSGHLSEPANEALAALTTTFAAKALPSPLDLGVTGGAGISLNALIGLTAPRAQAALPLASWGAGTRRLAALTIAGSLHARTPITIVDEVERGLEYLERTGHFLIGRRDAYPMVSTGQQVYEVTLTGINRTMLTLAKKLEERDPTPGYEPPSRDHPITDAQPPGGLH